MFDVKHPQDRKIQVAFASDDCALAIHSHGAIDFFDLAHGSCEQRQLAAAIGGAVAVSERARLIAAVTASGCGLWRLDDLQLVTTVPIDFDGAVACAFAPDGHSVAVAARNRALVVDVDSGSVRHGPHAFDQISDCRLLDERRLLLTTDWDCRLVVWDMQANAGLAQYEGHTYTANCCAVTPDVRIALTGGGDHTVRQWSLEERGASPAVDRHAKLVYGVAIDATAARACSAPQDARPVIWNARTGTRVAPVDTDVIYGEVQFVSFQGVACLAALGHSVRLFDATSAEPVWQAELPATKEHHSPRWISGGNTSPPHPGREFGTDRLPLILFGSKLLVWSSAATLQPVALGAEPAAVCPFDNGRALAVLHEGRLEIIELERPELRRPLAEGVKACVGSPATSSVYALMADGGLCRLDAGSGKVLAIVGTIDDEEVQLHLDPAESALFAVGASGRRVPWAGPARRVLRAFILDSPGEMRQADISDHDVRSTAFLGSRLVTAGWSDATLRVWDAGEPMPLAAISGTAPFRCVSAANDRIVAGDQKGNVWFLASMRELHG
jgi:WD40 repeat protein